MNHRNDTASAIPMVAMNATNSSSDSMLFNLCSTAAVLTTFPAVMMATEQLTPQQLHWFVDLATKWLKAFPMVPTLLILIAIDVISGCLVAISQQKLNSTTSWRGMTKKITILLLVGVGAVLQPFSHGLPLANMVSMFYIVTEAISILENAGALGVPLPQVMLDVLLKMKEAERERATQKLPPQVPVVTPPVIVIQESPKTDPAKTEP